jgi:hypothetical protein
MRMIVLGVLLCTACGGANAANVAAAALRPPTMSNGQPFTSNDPATAASYAATAATLGAVNALATSAQSSSSPSAPEPEPVAVEPSSRFRCQSANGDDTLVASSQASAEHTCAEMNGSVCSCANGGGD